MNRAGVVLLAGTDIAAARIPGFFLHDELGALVEAGLSPLQALRAATSNAAAIARHVGARHVVVTDVNDYRLELARKMGASRAINVSKVSIEATMKELGMTEGFDVGMEMSGNAAALRALLGSMNHGGRVAILGIPPGEVALDMNQVIFKGLILKGIYGREMFETWYKMSAMLTSGLDVRPVLTHRFAAEEYLKAFETMRSGQSGKVVLDWA